MSLFLTPEEIATLTGIRRGRDGKSRAQLQCAHLKSIGVPFFPNASGEPKVTRSYIEGRNQQPVVKHTGWQPAVLQNAV